MKIEDSTADKIIALINPQNPSIGTSEGIALKSGSDTLYAAKTELAQRGISTDWRADLEGNHVLRVQPKSIDDAEKLLNVKAADLPKETIYFDKEAAQAARAAIKDAREALVTSSEGGHMTPPDEVRAQQALRADTAHLPGNTPSTGTDRPASEAREQMMVSRLNKANRGLSV